MRFVVTQMGARRGYAVPFILERAGLLEHFYTDFAGNVGLGKWLVKCGPLLGRRAAARRLAARRVPDSIKSKTVTFGGQHFWHACAQRLCAADSKNRFREQLRRSRALGSAMIRHGFGRATHLYSMLGECGPVIGAAKQRGLRIVTEIYILLSAERILTNEQRHFPQWEPPPLNLDAVRNEFPEQTTLFAETDFFVCPSEKVRDDLEENLGFMAGRAAVVPYGVDPGWLAMPLKPVIGRVLFAGTAGLRKGIHYFADAAEKLHRKGRSYEFFVAGEVTGQVANQPACKHLNFIGRVPRDGMRTEFAAADVFTLPSLAEGSAESIYEALAAGLPVITTASAGSVVRHGIDGWIVPERDAEGLAWAIERIIEDRRLRTRMSIAARNQALDYTLQRYGERLTAALQDFSK